MTNVMPVGWTPQIKGRKPLVDPTVVYRKVRKNVGQWVVFDKYTLNECQSLDRQLTKFGCKTAIENQKTGKPRLYALLEEKP